MYTNWETRLGRDLIVLASLTVNDSFALPIDQ